VSRYNLSLSQAELLTVVKKGRWLSNRGELSPVYDNAVKANRLESRKPFGKLGVN